MAKPITINPTPEVARAFDRLALPGETREATLARLVWACSSGPRPEPADERKASR